MELNLRVRAAQQDILTLNHEVPLGAGITGVFGPSGAGKTTLLRCLAGLVPYQGEVAFQRQQINRVGMVFQQPGLFPHLNVRQNLALSARLSNQAGSAKNHLSVEQAVDHFDIHKLLDKSPHQLSGGEQQRVAIARSLLNLPDILLLDEPVSALDEQRRYQVLSTLQQLSEKLHMPMLLVSHSLHELAFCCDYLLHVEHGTITSQGPITKMVSELALQRQNPFALLDGSLTRVMDEYAMAELNIEGNPLYARSYSEHGGCYRLQVDASQVSLDLDSGNTSSIVNALPCQIVELSAHTGGKTLVTLQCGSQQLYALISQWSVTRLQLDVGQSVIARFKLI